MIFKWILGILIVLIILMGLFAYRNLNYDYGNEKFMGKTGKKLGFSEQIYTTGDGDKIAYLEGPDNGEPLLLIHGQQVSKEDYASGILRLSKHFHIYAVDYYGHGGSSKNPDNYNIITIRDDLISFMENVIGKKAIVTGHSSGALISAAIAAEAKELVSGLILEDGPFFTTLPDRAENTIAYKNFELIHTFLNQNQKSNYTQYYLDHAYIKHLFNVDEQDNWTKIVRNPYSKRNDPTSQKMPLIWYYPPELGLNGMIYITRNLQDETGPYDLRFGDTFYDFTWFKGWDQKTELAKIKVPTYILHVAPPEATAPKYYNEEGILLSAMDEKDADRVKALIQDSILKEGYKSGHDIHVDLPDEFIETVLEFKNIL